MVMVIDDAALRVVSALVGMYDVMEHRVTLIELLSKERQPLPVRLLVCLFRLFSVTRRVVFDTLLTHHGLPDPCTHVRTYHPPIKRCTMTTKTGDGGDLPGDADAGDDQPHPQGLCGPQEAALRQRPPLLPLQGVCCGAQTDGPEGGTDGPRDRTDIHTHTSYGRRRLINTFMPVFSLPLPTNQVNDALMNRLGSNPAFLQRVKTFKEINMNFLATEASAFHLDMPRCLPALFSTRPDGAVVEEVVHKLVSLCVTLNEYPHVRYNQNSVLGARLATLVQDALNVRLGFLSFVLWVGLGWVD